MILSDRSRIRALIADTIEREHVTGLPLVPTMATLLLRHDLSRHGVPTLRYITNAAAALSATKLRHVRETVSRGGLLLDVRPDRMSARVVFAAGTSRRAARFGRDRDSGHLGARDR